MSNNTDIVSAFRFQSKYVYITVSDCELNTDEIVEVFYSTNIKQLNLFSRKDNMKEIHIFLIFEEPKDIRYLNMNYHIISPAFFQFIDTSVIKNAKDNNFFSYLENIKNDTNFEPYYKHTEENGLFDVTIKGVNYFSNLNLDKIKSKEEIEKLEEDFNFFSNRIQRDLNSANRIKLFLDTILRWKPETDNSFLGPSSSGNPLVKKKHRITTVTEEKELKNILNNKNRRKDFFFEYLNKKTVKKDILENFLNYKNQEEMKIFIEEYIQKEKINISKSNNNLLKLIAMYYDLKKMPKKSDKNIWIKKLKNEFPEKFIQLFKDIL